VSRQAAAVNRSLAGKKLEPIHVPSEAEWQKREEGGGAPGGAVVWLRRS